MEMLDKIIYKFIGWIDGLNQKINDVLTMDFTNFSKRKKSVSVTRKKTWNKSKSREFICGYCTWCKKELLNTMGGWIITHERQYFCHDGKDGSCFDLYCNLKNGE